MGRYGARENPGEPAILYRAGPPDIFTAFFSDFLFSPAGMVHQKIRGMSQDVKKNEKPSTL
jgi:hypothetical protein